jgi:hypothetical protein
MLDTIEAARRDRLRADLWAMLNGSSEDAKAAGDAATARAAGDPDFRRGFGRFSREMRDRLTAEIVRKSA